MKSDPSAVSHKQSFDRIMRTQLNAQERSIIVRLVLPELIIKGNVAYICTMHLCLTELHTPGTQMYRGTHVRFVRKGSLGGCARIVMMLLSRCF